jgi:hypothetical protein
MKDRIATFCKYEKETIRTAAAFMSVLLQIAGLVMLYLRTR